MVINIRALLLRNKRTVNLGLWYFKLEGRASWLLFYVSLVLCNYYCYVSLPHSALGLSAVCDFLFILTCF